MLVAPDPAWRGIAGRARRPGSPRLIAIGVAGVALAVGGAAVANGIVGDPAPSDAAVASASAEPSRAPSATESAPGSPSTSASTSAPETPTPTAIATPTPTSPPSTPAPTAVPTAVPTAPPPETYVVAEDDTLVSIAERFGTTVGALQAANDIDDPDEIVIGDVLVIP